MSYEVGQILHRAYFRCRSRDLHFDDWVVVRVTPKGGWITPRWRWEEWQADIRQDEKDGNVFAALGRAEEDLARKWVPLDARFCSVTREEAVARLGFRTRAYLRHARAAFREAERRMELLKVVPDELPNPAMGMDALVYRRAISSY